MTQIDGLSHPPVELKLPVDGADHRCVIPTDMTLFCWQAIAPGIGDRLAPVDTPQGINQTNREVQLRENISWSVSIDGENIPLLDDTLYRNSGYRGVAWWTATDAFELPAELTIHIETGDQPTVDTDALVCWTDSGQRLPWSQHIESTVYLQPRTDPGHEFDTHREQLWNRHRVYEASPQPI
jgi:hypothetical protein